MLLSASKYPFLAALLFLATPLVATAEPGHSGSEQHDQSANQDAESVGDPYPLTTDPVSGEPLTADAVAYAHQGRHLRFNTEQTMKLFLQDPAKHLAALDETLIAYQRPHYPLMTCPVSGGELGSMGEPVEIVVGNRLVRLCCAGCEKSVRENPEPVIAKLDAAVVKEQSKNYPLTTCPISGGELGSMGEPVHYVIANRLVKLCCAGCVATLEKDAAAALKKLDTASKSTDSPEAKSDEHDGHDH